MIDTQSHVETNKGLSRVSKASAALEIEISRAQVPRATTRRMFLASLPGFAAISIMVCHSGCDRRLRSEGAGDQRKFKVVATTGMIGDMLRELCGDSVEITQLIQAGVDPHLYKPIRDDIVAIVQSDAVFHNGLHLEGRMGDVLTRSSGRRDASIPQTSFAMSDALTKNDLLGEPGTDAHDPHIWMDVSLWTRCVESVSGELMKLLPGAAGQIATRFEELRERLTKLDQKAIEAVKTIPESQRVLISSHDAFQYFGRRYGLRVEGVQGISTASEAGLQRIPDLIETVVSRRIPAVFKESSVGGKLIDALIAGARARGVELLIGNELYSDALGPVGSGAENYLGMMTHNFNSVITALGGKWE